MGDWDVAAVFMIPIQNTLNTARASFVSNVNGRIVMGARVFLRCV